MTETEDSKQAAVADDSQLEATDAASKELALSITDAD